MQRSEIAYAEANGASIAYQVVGDGDQDLVFIPSWFSHLELLWDEPRFEEFLSELSSFARLIIFDPPGSGLSDPLDLNALPTIETRCNAIATVMDAAGSRTAVIFGATLGGLAAMAFAAEHPDRTDALVLYNTTARYWRAGDYDIGLDEAHHDEHFGWMEHWGNERRDQGLANDRLRAWLPRYQRMSMGPRTARILFEMNLASDVRDKLPKIKAPTLVIHREKNRTLPISHGCYIADRISGARFLEVHGEDYHWIGDDSRDVLAGVHEFVTGEPPTPRAPSALAVVLFTDIVGSTEQLSRLGDRGWREMRQAHDAAATQELERHAGTLIELTGDGILATFNAPAQGVRCAFAIRDRLSHLGLRMRAGLHVGEVELLPTGIGGIAVHIGARVVAMAGDAEVLVTGTMKDVLAGSRFGFIERGAHALKGVDGEWPIYGVER